jgi:hypothetical protein
MNRAGPLPPLRCSEEAGDRLDSDKPSYRASWPIRPAREKP